MDYVHVKGDNRETVRNPASASRQCQTPLLQVTSCKMGRGCAELGWWSISLSGYLWTMGPQGKGLPGTYAADSHSLQRAENAQTGRSCQIALQPDICNVLSSFSGSKVCMIVELAGRVGDDCSSAWIAWNKLPDCIDGHYKWPLDLARDGFYARYRLQPPKQVTLWEG